MSPPRRQSVARISEELGIHVITLYKWRKTWWLQGEVVPASEKEPEGWSAADKFTVVLETAGLNATELSAYCRERGLFPEQVSRWRQAAQDANAKPVLTMSEQKELEKLRAQDQREIKALKKELQRTPLSGRERIGADRISASCMSLRSHRQAVHCVQACGWDVVELARGPIADEPSSYSTP